MEGGDLLTITINKDIILPNDKIGVGESIRRLLQKEISPFKKFPSLMSKDAYAEVTKHMMLCLHIQNNLMRRLRYLYSALRLKYSSASSIKAAARKLPQVLSTNDIDKFGGEWFMYQSDKELKIAYSLIVETNHHVKPAMAAKPRKMEDVQHKLY